MHDGQPDLGDEHGNHAREPGWGDPDDGVRLPTQLQRTPDHTAIAAKVADPHAMRDDQNAIRTRCVISGHQHASQERRNAEHIEMVGGHQLADDESGAIAQTQRRKHRRVRDHVGENGVLRSQFEIIRVRGGRILVAVTTAGEDIDQRGRILNRDGAQQNRVYQRKHRRVDADAKPQRENRHCRKPRTPAQPPDGIAQVFQHRKVDVGAQGSSGLSRSFMTGKCMISGVAAARPPRVRRRRFHGPFSHRSRRRHRVHVCRGVSTAPRWFESSLTAAAPSSRRCSSTPRPQGPDGRSWARKGRVKELPGVLNEAEFKRTAERMGVQPVSLTPLKEGGFEGAKAIFAFDDISKIRVDQDPQMSGTSWAHSAVLPPTSQKPDQVWLCQTGCELRADHYG